MKLPGSWSAGWTTVAVLALGGTAATGAAFLGRLLRAYCQAHYGW